MNETIEEKKKILNTYGAAVRKYHALKNQEKHLRMIINRQELQCCQGCHQVINIKIYLIL